MSSNQTGQFISELIRNQSEPVSFQELVVLIEEALSVSLDNDELTMVSETLLGGVNFGYIDFDGEKFFIPIIDELEN